MKTTGGQGIARGGSGAGFTVLELIVAVSVLLVATLTAFSSQVTSMSLMNTSRQTNTAMSDLQAAMEQLLLVPVADLPASDDGVYPSGQAIPAFDDLHLRNERIVATYPGYVEGAPVPLPLTIVLTISWDDFAGRPRQLALRSMKVD